MKVSIILEAVNSTQLIQVYCAGGSGWGWGLGVGGVRMGEDLPGTRQLHSAVYGVAAGHGEVGIGSPAQELLGRLGLPAEGRRVERALPDQVQLVDHAGILRRQQLKKPAMVRLVIPPC